MLYIQTAYGFFGTWNPLYSSSLVCHNSRNSSGSNGNCKSDGKLIQNIRTCFFNICQCITVSTSIKLIPIQKVYWLRSVGNQQASCIFSIKQPNSSLFLVGECSKFTVTHSFCTYVKRTPDAHHLSSTVNNIINIELRVSMYFHGSTIYLQWTHHLC